MGRQDDDSPSTSQEVGSWIKKALRGSCLLDHSAGYVVSQERVKHWAKLSSRAQVLPNGGCASMLHNVTGSNFTTTVQSFLYFNCKTQV